MALTNVSTQMNGLIDDLKRYDNQVISLTAEKEKLEDDAEVLSKNPFVLGQQSIAISGIGQSDVIGITKVINSWIAWASSPSKTPQQIVGDAVWQVWLGFKKTGTIAGTTFIIKNYPTFDSFLYRLLNSGILNQTSVSYGWTDYDRKVYEADLKDAEIDVAEKNYDTTYSLATKLRDDNKISIASVKLDIYENRKARRERRATRKKARTERHNARKEVDSIIWNLENKLNPAERVIVADYEKNLITMEAIANRNKESEQAKFIEVGKVVETKEVELANAHVVIDSKEARLKVLADLYDFAERKMEKYMRKDARKDYRNKKKAEKEAYKLNYGKGWKKEVGWDNIKTDLKQEKVDKLDEYAGIARKTGNAIKTTVFTAPRIAFLGLMETNALNMAGRLLELKKNAPEIYDNFRFKWKQFGGNRTELDKSVEKNGVKKAFPSFGGKLSADGSQYYYSATVVATATATATPILTSLAATFSSVGAWIIANPDKALAIAKNTFDSLTGDPAQDAKIKEDALNASIDLVNNMTELTEAQKAIAIASLKAGKSLADAITDAGIDLGLPTDPDTEPLTESNNTIWWIVGGVAFVCIVGGLIWYFSRKR